MIQKTQIQEAIELCSTRLQNGGGSYRQKLQCYISCLSRITIAADEKGECLLSKDWLGPEMVNNYKAGP